MEEGKSVEDLLPSYFSLFSGIFTLVSPFPLLLLPLVARPLFLPVPLSSFYSLPLVHSLSSSHGPTDSQINYSNVIFIAEV